MSGPLSLPPAEPPADNITGLLDRLRAAQGHLDDATRMANMLDVAARDTEPLTVPSVDYFRIEKRVAANRVVLWRRHVRDLERRGRSMGLAL